MTTNFLALLLHNLCTGDQSLRQHRSIRNVCFGVVFPVPRYYLIFLRPVLINFPKSRIGPFHTIISLRRTRYRLATIIFSRSISFPDSAKLLPGTFENYPSSRHSGASSTQVHDNLLRLPTTTARLCQNLSFLLAAAFSGVRTVCPKESVVGGYHACCASFLYP